MSINRIITLTILTLSLAACATNNTGNESASNKTSDIRKIMKLGSSKENRSDEWLLFLDRFSNASIDVQKKMFNETNHLLTEDKSNLAERVKLAIMLSLPSSKLRDTAKAQNLLQDILQSNNLNSTESAFTGLLYEYVVYDNKLTQKNKDDLKKSEVTQQKLEALQQKYDALDKKLNDLKNIEKTINERDVKAANKPTVKP